MPARRTRPRALPAGTSVRVVRSGASSLDAAHCPIEALYEEHFQQRQMASDMEALAATRVPRPGLARRIVDNLVTNLPRHRIDEDESLFPRLRRRAEPADEIGPLLDRLAAEHVLLRALATALMPALGRLSAGALPAAGDRAALRHFAQAERRHLAIENALVLPLARLRLTAADKARILAEMRARRAGPPPGPAG